MDKTQHLHHSDDPAGNPDLQLEEALAAVLDMVLGAKDLDAGILEALARCRAATGADDWALIGQAGAESAAVLASSDPTLVAAVWPQQKIPFAAGPRITEQADPADLAEPAGLLRAYRAFLTVPVEVPFQPAMAIALMSRGPGAFGAPHLAFLRRVGGLLGQALANRQLTRRTAALATVLNPVASPPPPQSRFLDTSFEALQHSFGRVARWQGQIVDITNELLGAHPAETDAAINRALERMGQLAESDRTYVFRLRNGNRLDNTHEWVAPGIAPMIAHLQDMPTDLLDDWRGRFLAGQAVQIDDVDALPEDSVVRGELQSQGIRSLLAVPMLRDGEITGFVGYDAVRALRHYLPLEIQLLQSVCNAIRAVRERVEAEIAAEQARQSLQATLLAVPELVLVLDHEGRFTGQFAGSGQAAIHTDAELIGRKPAEVFSSKAADLTERLMRFVDKGGPSGLSELNLEINGQQRTFLASAAPQIMGGKPVGYVIALRDITHRLKERRQLQRLGKIAELTSNLVVITDAEQRIEWVNPAFERRTGWTLDEVRGKRPESFLAFEKTNRLELSRIGKLLRAGQPARAELLNRSRSGEEYWISKDIQPLLDASGGIEGFVAVQTDITDLKTSHLRALQDRAQAMDASSDGIAITDADGHYLYMNAAHRSMFGIGLTEDVQSLHWQSLYTQAQVATILTKVWPQLETIGTWRGDLYGRHRDGHLVAQEVSLTRREQGLLCITRDISQRLQLEADRSRLREELQSAQGRETVAQLAGGVAHDLNNLVAVVAGSATLLQEFCPDNPDMKAGLQRILRATETATDLVAGLSRLGRPHRQRDIHDLRKVLVEAIDLLGSQRIRAHHVTASLPPDPCPVWANVTELLQVAVNLALNACQAGPGESNDVTLTALPQGTPPPEGAPEVGKLAKGASFQLFRIADTGNGIDASARRRLFDRYFTTKGAEGTGLGLPIVAGILRDNDAALWIDSTPGLGTTVTVAWPSTAPGALAGAGQARPDATPLASLAGHRILVVDDMPDVADVLSEMLETAEAVTIAVSDPDEALELMTDNPGLWSALVTDQDMPGLRGSDLARAARACVPPIPTILVTALREQVGTESGLFDQILAKPITRELLVAAVGQAISGPGPCVTAGH